MAPKYDPHANEYRKPARELTADMMQALGPGGVMRPVMERVLADDRLRLDIRHRQINVYYGGGNLMTAEWCKSAWHLGFDQNYFKGSARPAPDLPATVYGPGDAQAWADAFDLLTATMNDWWTRHPKGERADCQDIARANNARQAAPETDFVILDLEYQWAQRRFDLIAARRHPTAEDQAGWALPDLAYVEVKSEIGACTGKAGLADHARDFADIVTARGGAYIQGIKDEYATVIRQKQELGLISAGFPFQAFSPGPPQLVFVTVGLDLDTMSRSALWNPVRQTAQEIGLPGFQLIQLRRPDLRLTTAKVKWI